MPQKVNDLISRYLSEIKKIYGMHLKRVVLYGSYARGDYTEESDIDIMILVDLPQEISETYSDELSEIGFEYNVNYGVWVMPIVKNETHFEKWASADPFYSNVCKEGVVLYEAA